MPRVTKIVRAADRTAGPIADTLLLNYVQRTAQSGFVFGSKGTCVELDFTEPVLLRTDDLLTLDDGTLVEVVADVEPLIEARVTDAALIGRIAWQLGNRHVPIEIKANRLRVRRDPAIEALLGEFGLKLTAIEAPFAPEELQTGGHDHHHHGHHHHHHDHGHGHDHDHDHAHGHDHAHRDKRT